MSRSGSTTKVRIRAPYLLRLGAALDAVDMDIGTLITVAIAPTGRALFDFSDDELLLMIEQYVAHVASTRGGRP